MMGGPASKVMTAAGHAAAVPPVRMPSIIYGTAWKKERTADLVRRAIKAGYRGIDTACQPKHYYEPGVGEALGSCGVPREQIYVQTKYTPISGQDASKPLPYDKSAAVEAQVAQSVLASLTNLRTSWLDCLLLHSPLPDHEQTLRAWRAMEGEHAAGRARSLGVSNMYDERALRRLYREAAVKPSVVQNRFYADTGYDEGVRAFCAEAGVAYQSFWTLSANPHALASPAVSRAAARHGCTAAQAWFGFVRGLGVVPLCGTTDEAHMAETLDLPTLDADEMAAVGEVLRRKG